MMERAVVVIVAVAVAAVVPLSVTVAGKEQEVADGAPVQLNNTVPVKPRGVMVRV
jgi:hypothetical protein